MGNVLSDDKKQQVVALGRLGWSLRRIEEATGIRRESASAYLKAAGIPVRGAGGRPEVFRTARRRCLRSASGSRHGCRRCVATLMTCPPCSSDFRAPQDLACTTDRWRENHPYYHGLTEHANEQRRQKDGPWIAPRGVLHLVHIGTGTLGAGNREERPGEGGSATMTALNHTAGEKSGPGP